MEIIEHIEITCVCGHHFSEDTIRNRVAAAHEDIGCPECDRRMRISEGANQVRERDPEMDRKTWALRTEIENRRNEILDTVKQVFAKTQEERRTDKPIRVLHLSDLHFASDLDPITSLRPLVTDIKDKVDGLGFDSVDYLVVSGDITNRATPEEFEIAQQFISGVIKELELTAERCIIVPGNHDLSWAEDVYDLNSKRRVDVGKLRSGYFYEQGDIVLIRDDKRYTDRFKNFSKSFYHTLIQSPYPLAFEDQCIPYLFEETRLQFITLNSTWEIDEWFPHRASVHSGALARGLTRADEQVQRQLGNDTPVLRIAVLHHPVTGNEKVHEDAFVEQLRQANIQLILHGHVHEDRAELIGYLHPRNIRVAGAGSFGAPTNERPESTPRLYNLLEIERDHSGIKVHTRSLRRDGGAWEGWAIWPGSSPQEKSTYYTIDLDSHES